MLSMFPTDFKIPCHCYDLSVHCYNYSVKLASFAQQQKKIYFLAYILKIVGTYQGKIWNK
jgi:hypothetical protein